MSIKKSIQIFALAVAGISYGLNNAAAQKNNPPITDETKILTPKEVEVIATYYDATTQKLLGNNKEALNLFLLCIAKDPKNSAAYFEAARIYNVLKQPTLGVSYAKLATDLNSKNKWYLEEYADLLIQTGKIKQASKVYDQLLKLEPNNQDYQIQKADILIYLKQYKGAIAIYDKLEKKLGIVAEIVLQKQKLYLAQGKYNDAEREMQRLIDKYPNDPEYYGMFAEFYLNINKKEKAMTMFQKVLELDPNNPIIHLAMANYYQDNGQTDKAYEYIKMAFNNPDVELDNKIKIMLSYYDLSANNAQRKIEAEELLAILLQVHPEEPKAWSVKGDFLLRDEKLTDAIAAYEKVLSLQNDKYPVWNQLLQLYVETGNYVKLKSESEKAVELFPNMPMFYWYNGYSNYILNNHTTALESYLTGKDFVINNAEQKVLFLIGLAEVNIQLKRYVDADTYFESAFNTLPNNINVLTSYAFYLVNIKKDMLRAGDLFSKAFKISATDYRVLDLQAWMSYKSGKITDASITIEDAIKNGGGEDAQVLEHYGDILFKDGKTEGALEQWKKAKNAKGKYSDLLDTKIQQQKLVE